MFNSRIVSRCLFNRLSTVRFLRGADPSRTGLGACWMSSKNSNESSVNVLLLVLTFVLSSTSKFESSPISTDSNGNKSIKMESKEKLRARLTPLQYQVTQEAGTERPFTGCYNKHYEKGTYHCIVCHQPLFTSDTKYDSGCGWPAFNDVLDQGKITLHRDASIAERIRTEVRCAKCGAHMGHVFDDGPMPTRKRYCINSAAIEFVPKEDAADSANAS